MSVNLIISSVNGSKGFLLLLKHRGLEKDVAWEGREWLDHPSCLHLLTASLPCTVVFRLPSAALFTAMCNHQVIPCLRRCSALTSDKLNLLGWGGWGQHKVIDGWRYIYSRYESKLPDESRTLPHIHASLLISPTGLGPNLCVGLTAKDLLGEKYSRIIFEVINPYFFFSLYLSFHFSVPPHLSRSWGSVMQDIVSGY